MQVFIRCRQQYAMSMAGAVALGITAQETESACRLAGVPADRWPQTSEHVQHMGNIAAVALNDRRGA